MKFNVNINYLVEGDEFDEVLSIVTQLTEKGSFSYGKVKVVGMNMNVVYVASGVEAKGATQFAS